MKSGVLIQTYLTDWLTAHLSVCLTDWHVFGVNYSLQHCGTLQGKSDNTHGCLSVPSLCCTDCTFQKVSFWGKRDISHQLDFLRRFKVAKDILSPWQQKEYWEECSPLFCHMLVWVGELRGKGKYSERWKELQSLKIFSTVGWYIHGFLCGTAQKLWQIPFLIHHT